MQIDIDNYEQFFLLYIDDELNEQDRKSVLDFVQQHPQLAIELNNLRLLKLPDENAFVFPNKQALYKTAGAGINQKNYEEYFLLHADNELSVNEEEETERFILQHPQLQEEFMLLQRAKLSPEIIECPDKKKLYKRNKKTTPFYISLLAMAAMLAGVVLLVWQPTFNTNKPAQIAVNKKAKNTAPQLALPQNKTEIILPKSLPENAKLITDKKVQQHTQLQKTSVNEAIDNAKYNDEKKPESAQNISLPAIEPPLQTQQNIAINTATTAHTEATVLKPLEEINTNNTSDTKLVYASADNGAAQPAAYKELHTDEDDNTLHVALLQLNKAKVNGMFKKAAHLFGNRTKEQTID